MPEKFYVIYSKEIQFISKSLIENTAEIPNHGNVFITDGIKVRQRNIIIRIMALDIVTFEGQLTLDGKWNNGPASFKTKTGGHIGPLRFDEDDATFAIPAFKGGK